MIGSGINRGTAELAVLSVLQDGPLHGYALARRIEQQTYGALRFTLAALYPIALPDGAEALDSGRLGNEYERPAVALLPAHARRVEEAVTASAGMG